MDEWERGTFLTNTDKMIHYILDGNNNIDENTCSATIKLYDHIQLAMQQIEGEEQIFARDIEDAKESIRDDSKEIEKEYITILGIFAAIVLAFVGGITFSSSVLQNIDAVSPYRLFLVIDLLGFILINTIYWLIKQIFVINIGYEADEEMGNSIVKINTFLIIVGIVILIAWLFSVDHLVEIIYSKVYG